MIDDIKKSFCDKNYIYVYLLFIPNIIFVYLNNCKKYNNITGGGSILNERIYKNICIWNLLHAILYFILCSILQLENIYDYINICIVMILWFLFEYIVYKLNEKLDIVKINKNIINNLNGVYDNPYIPRYDDFVFNTIGMIFYILLNIY